MSEANTMTKEALTLALEALQVATTPLAKDRQEVLRAITAIKEALSSPNGEAQPEQEPVAWMGTDIEGNPNKFRLNQFSGSFPLYAQTQPWTDDLALIAYLDGVKDGKKITPPQRKPLTDKQIDALYEQHIANCWDSIEDQMGDPVRIMARAIEAAHGIKE